MAEKKSEAAQQEVFSGQQDEQQAAIFAAAQGQPGGLMPGKEFPSLVDFLVFFGIFLLSQVIGGLAGWILAGWPDAEALASADDAVASAAQIAAAHFNAISYFVAMSLTLCSFLYYRYRRRGPSVIARFSVRGFNPALILWGVVFLFATSVALEPVLKLLPEVPNAYGRGLWAVVTLVVMAPLFEEVIFRGVILESSRAKYGVMGAWLISSAVFGIVHGHPALVINAFVAGLILGFIYIRSGSLWAAVILHAINNGIAYLALATGHANALLIDLVGSRTLYVVIYIAALAVLVISGYMVYRTLVRMNEGEKNPPQA